MPNSVLSWPPQGGQSKRSMVVDCDHQCHCWFYTGEAHAIRQKLGHGVLPQSVGDMTAATYGCQGDG